MQKFQKLTENGKWELHLIVRVGPVGLECGLRVPGSGTQMSSIAGQLWKFSDFWLVCWGLPTGLGEAVLWVLPGAENREQSQLAPTSGQVGR